MRWSRPGWVCLRRPRGDGTGPGGTLQCPRESGRAAGSTTIGATRSTAELPKSSWLSEYANSFDTVECDNAFYRLPTRDTFAKWAAALPAGFTMAVKASRFLTHVKRLNEPAEPVRRLLESCEGLGDRLGPILLQLPPNLRCRGSTASTRPWLLPTSDPGRR